MKYFNKILAVVLIFTIVFTNVITSNEKVKADEDTSVSTNTPFCLFCDGDEEDAKKEKQFADRIQIIKKIFGDSVDSAALASTVLYLKFEEGVEQYYDENFNKDDYEEQWSGMKNNIESNQDDALKWFFKGSDDSLTMSGVDVDKMDVLTAATIVMVLSNGIFGPYDEEKYKEALMLDKGFTNTKLTVGVYPLILTFDINDIFCNPFSSFIASAVETASGILNNLNPFTENKNFTKYIATMNNICAHGFLEANYPSVSGIKDDTKRKYAKEKLADSILEDAKMYNPWFSVSESECAYDSSSQTTSNTAENWRQTDTNWSKTKLGKTDQTLSEAGSASVAMAYLIQKSGTAVTTSDFDPKAFAKNAEYKDNGTLKFNSIKDIAPNWVTDKKSVKIDKYDAKSVAPIIETELNLKAGKDNKNQTFVIIQMTKNWVAVDHVDGDNVYVLDPASSAVGLTTLEEALKQDEERNDGKAKLINYSTFYATDVAYSGNGKTGTNSSVKANTSIDYTSDTYKDRLKNLKDYEQCGEKLSNVALGNSNVCKSGCMVASLASIYYMFTGTPTDVKALIKDMLEEGEWANGQAGMGTPYFDTPNSSPLITKKWGLSGETLNSSNKNKMKTAVIDALKSGKKILLNLGGTKTTYSTNGGHFLMLDHYNEKTKKIYIFNPGGSGTGYITESELVSEVLNYNKYGPWAISSGTVNGTTNYCDETTSKGDVSGFAKFINRLEGGQTCNYKGQGKGTGYTVEDIGDGEGWTASNGMTQGDNGYALKVGYKTYLADLNSGCVNKKYLDQMQQAFFDNHIKPIKAAAKKRNIELTENELYALVSVSYGGDAYLNVLDAIKSSSKTSWKVFHCMVSHGCGFTAEEKFNNGLANRRAAEYEIFRAGNYDAVKIEKGYDYYNSIQSDSELEKYMKKYWPSNKKK